MRSSVVVAPRSRAFGFVTSTGPIPVWIARTGSCPWRTTRRRPSGSTSSAVEARNVSNAASTAWAINRRAPVRRISVSGSSIALSVERQQLYSRSWRNAPTWRFGWLDHQPRYAAFLTPSPSSPHSSAPKPDSGALRVADKEVTLGSLSAARAGGLAVVHQELMLFPDRTVDENVRERPAVRRVSVDQRRFSPRQGRSDDGSPRRCH